MVKGVLLGINPRARLVDLTHAVPAQDIRRASLLLEGAWRFFPPGSVHLAVVDPGVGQRPPADRRGGGRPLLRRARQRAPRVLLRLARRSRGRADGRGDSIGVRSAGRSTGATCSRPWPPTARAACGWRRWARRCAIRCGCRRSAAPARSAGRRRGAAGRPLREPADESPGSGSAGPGGPRRLAGRRRPRARAGRDLRRAAPRGARGGDRQLGPGRGVRA